MDEEICVKIDGYQDQLLNSLHQLQLRGINCDVTLKACDGDVNLHSIILVATSVLHAQNRNDRSSLDTGYVNRIIDCTKYSVYVVTAVVKYLYTGEIKIGKEYILELKNLCEKLSSNTRSSTDTLTPKSATDVSYGNTVPQNENANKRIDSNKSSKAAVIPPEIKVKEEKVDPGFEGPAYNSNNVFPYSIYAVKSGVYQNLKEESETKFDVIETKISFGKGSQKVLPGDTITNKLPNTPLPVQSSTPSHRNVPEVESISANNSGQFRPSLLKHMHQTITENVLSSEKERYQQADCETIPQNMQQKQTITKSILSSKTYLAMQAYKAEISTSSPLMTGVDVVQNWKNINEKNENGFSPNFNITTGLSAGHDSIGNFQEHFPFKKRRIGRSSTVTSGVSSMSSDSMDNFQNEKQTLTLLTPIDGDHCDIRNPLDTEKTSFSSGKSRFVFNEDFKMKGKHRRLGKDTVMHADAENETFVEVDDMYYENDDVFDSSSDKDSDLEREISNNSNKTRTEFEQSGKNKQNTCSKKDSCMHMCNTNECEESVKSIVKMEPKHSQSDSAFLGEMEDNSAKLETSKSGSCSTDSGTEDNLSGSLESDELKKSPMIFHGCDGKYLKPLKHQHTSKQRNSVNRVVHDVCGKIDRSKIGHQIHKESHQGKTVRKEAQV